ncbi:hypothetical protein APA46_30365 [Pseudomonas aeruginosa]|nr:hypothetical protein APA46_30365 [Pseudomonas aeruginosa]PBY24604.1 hypothetical protein CJT61_01880 [Pseudomonas aeruginosa]PCB91949.1 hypothetical protein CJT62_11245 [Pseudomonas aeruginosa]RPZ34273.1 hypothetical protein IPC563_09825 [Pseudomonas aeruginosa]RUA90141.1 hypothetical protein IPC1434_03020 [Pseudomonas aeruginosa]
MSDASMQPLPNRISCPPRVVRAGTAPAYLGMCRDEFNKTVRPYVREFRIGRQGIGFDREELDAWADDYIERTVTEKNGAQGQDRFRSERQGEKPWREKPSLVSTRETESGISTRSSEVSDFKKALAQATGRKQNST